MCRVSSEARWPRTASGIFLPLLSAKPVCLSGEASLSLKHLYLANVLPSLWRAPPPPAPVLVIGELLQNPQSTWASGKLLRPTPHLPQLCPPTPTRLLPLRCRASSLSLTHSAPPTCHSPLKTRLSYKHNGVCPGFLVLTDEGTSKGLEMVQTIPDSKNAGSANEDAATRWPSQK